MLLFSLPFSPWVVTFSWSIQGLTVFLLSALLTNPSKYVRQALILFTYFPWLIYSGVSIWRSVSMSIRLEDLDWSGCSILLPLEAAGNWDICVPLSQNLQDQLIGSSLQPPSLIHCPFLSSSSSTCSIELPNFPLCILCLKAYFKVNIILQFNIFQHYSNDVSHKKYVSLKERQQSLS